MGIQNDRWITQMARDCRMIEPFEGRQVRQGVISYGVSSYGYDMRVAREFRIFTNVLNSVVDPKAFDPKSFVEFEGDVCIVPPNSFALARSVEYFRIPRDVVTVCVGKSTYARCFSGDTRVALVDGTSVTLEDMVERSQAEEVFWGYGVTKSGRIVVAQLTAPRFVARDRLLEITLDNDQVIRATPDHGFIMRSGEVLPAERLRPGHSLMPLYRERLEDCESVSQPCDDQLTLANHKVTGVRHIAGEHDVYCLTVPETGNFALDAGVFVENCGIITNVTPFEPEWEGYVTLEISNTTPLPAKIYANEGIAQVLFFKGDEPPEVSYADKKGKYQGQQGVTLPKL